MKVTLFPKQVQEELVNYPETILDDPYYLLDEQCMQKYGSNPMVYLMASDQSLREQIEQGGEPSRYYEARRNRGLSNFKNLGKELVKLAMDTSLEALGIPKEMTKDRRDGKLKRPDAYLV